MRPILAANRRVALVWSAWAADGQTHAIRVVRHVPPRASFNACVSFDER